jgi:hypothetical protein
MQVPYLIWSELVSYGADSFESVGCNERQPFRNWGISHALTASVGSPVAPVHGGKSRRATLLLDSA